MKKNIAILFMSLMLIICAYVGNSSAVTITLSGCPANKTVLMGINFDTSYPDAQLTRYNTYLQDGFVIIPVDGTVNRQVMGLSDANGQFRIDCEKTNLTLTVLSCVEYIAPEGGGCEMVWDNEISFNFLMGLAGIVCASMIAYAFIHSG